MRPDIYRLLWMLVSTAVFAASGFSSPLNSKLLSLVPSGAELVGGFENHPDGRRAGRLLLATRNDRVDLDDWQALAGVDSKRVIDEVIEVAAASSTGRLTEHLLLVAGKFDREKIFHAAELNGAERGQYEGETILLIKPFAREQHEMLDTRWLMILNNRIAMLGTQPMVQKALYRYTTHADIDMPLMERLSQMRPDVSSWNVVVGSAKVENSLNLTQPNSMLTRLIKGAAVLMVGTRFGHKIRVDFSLLNAGSETSLSNQKTASFSDVFAKEPTFPSASRDPSQRWFGNFSFESNRAQGSVEFSEKEFREWSQLGGFGRSAPVNRTQAHGE
jgi:hypothetical protein